MRIPRMKRKQLLTAILLFITTLALCSCETISKTTGVVGETAKDAGKAVKSGSKKAWDKVDQTPSAIGKSVASGSKSVGKKFALATNLPSKWYSKEISGAELKTKMNTNKLGSWFYMGTRHGYHYFAWETTERQIFRVKEGQYSVDNPFPLANLKSNWRAISRGSQPVFLD
jgi:hypothetical protein